MNKRVLNISLILLLASTCSVFAQQGFGTNKPSQSAAVDIVSPNKGLLIPRVALQADNLAAPITNPEPSLLVFNTTATNNLTKGFYYWTGTNWEPFTTESTDSDNQQIIDFSIGANNIVTLELERGGTKQVDLSPYFNSTKLANGTNTTVSGTGTSTDQYKVNVANATTSNLGVVQIGSGINVDTNGVISVPAAPGETTTVLTDVLTGANKHKIADYKNESANAPVNVYETITSLTQTAEEITYIKEDGISSSAKVVSANAGNLITPGTDFGALLTKDNVQNNQVKYQVINGNNTTASLDPSSTTDLQKYKVDVTFPTIDGSETKLIAGLNTTVSGTGTATDQYKVNVATGNDRTLGVVREAETDPTVNVTNGELAVNLANTILSGEVIGPLNNTVVKDDVIDAANLKTDAVVTNKIANANVTPVKIQPAPTFTQTQVMVTGTDGAVKWVDQSTISPATTVSNTSSDNTLITTVNSVSSTSVDLVKTVGLSLTGNNLTATVNGVSNTTALDLSSIDTDNQQISYNAATRMLSLERGGDPVDLSALATDNNTITTVKADAAQSYVSVTSNPVTPGATLDREYTVGVSAATAQVGATAGTAGVVKPGHQFEIETDGHLSVKYAMPEFFYFPAINIPLSNPNGSLDLYGIYASRWGAPMAMSTTTENQNLADIIIPVNMVDFFITYYDDTVIENVVISDAGVMTYTVKSGYVLTDESYMNILFKIRKTAK